MEARKRTPGSEPRPELWAVGKLRESQPRGDVSEGEPGETGSSEDGPPRAEAWVLLRPSTCRHPRARRLRVGPVSARAEASPGTSPLGSESRPGRGCSQWKREAVCLLKKQRRAVPSEQLMTGHTWETSRGRFPPGAQGRGLCRAGCQHPPRHPRSPGTHLPVRPWTTAVFLSRSPGASRHQSLHLDKGSDKGLLPTDSQIPGHPPCQGEAPADRGRRDQTLGSWNPREESLADLDARHGQRELGATCSGRGRGSRQV